MDNPEPALPSGTHWLLDLNPQQDQYLYHYTTAGSLAQILDSERLLLGCYAKTNDPREQKEWHARVIFQTPVGPGDIEVLDEAHRAERQVDRLLRHTARLACFTRDRPPSRGAAPGSLFHRGWARARMWDQYAQRHMGACLVFDREVLQDQISKGIPHEPFDLILSAAVDYVDAPLTLDLNWGEVRKGGIGPTVRTYQVGEEKLKHLYFTKNRDWQSEEEFRIVFIYGADGRADTSDPILIPYGEALKAVVVGEQFPPTERSVVRARSGWGSEVDLFTCSWGYGGEPVLFPS